MIWQRLIPFIALIKSENFDREAELDTARGESRTSYPLTECEVPELNLICTARCEEDQLLCFVECESDMTCVSECIRDGTKCIQGCPCEIGCIDGCDGCSNPVCDCEHLETNRDWNICIDDNGATLGRCIHACKGDENCELNCIASFKRRQANCPCEANCIGGCPCQDYSCLETTSSPNVTTTVPQTTSASFVNAILVLSTYHKSNKPIIIDFDGNINDDIDFVYGEGTEAVHGCGTTFMGQFWYFGGYFHTIGDRQASKIEGCKLVRQHDLPFHFASGVCNSFLQPIERVLLCFDDNHGSTCSAFDGENYHSVENSKFYHKYNQIADYRGEALVTGCSSYNGEFECSIKTEIMDMATLKWSDAADYPFTSSSICLYSVASTSNSAYIIGGSYTLDVVAEFIDFKWRQLDNLNKGRHYHSSLSVGGQSIIIGGRTESESAETEVWQFENGNNKVIEPTFQSGHVIAGVGVYPVDFNFCHKNL